MNASDWPFSTTAVLYALVFVILGVLALAITLLLWVIWKVRRIDLPPNADVVTALRAAPLAVVVVLDLLDLALDIFSAPIAWVLLTRLGLAPLRLVTLIKDLIPFDNIIPAMTLAWLIVRVMDRRRAYAPQLAKAANRNRRIAGSK